MAESAPNRIEINGAAATVDDLRALAATNYGHFTSMRVEHGAVRGLSLHLDRLEQSTRTLFNTTLDRNAVRAYLRKAVGDESRRLSVRVNVFSRAFDREKPGAMAQPEVLVAVAATSVASAKALRVKSFVFERTLPEVKHVGTFPLFHHRRLAQDHGFDDALFVDRHGMVSEGSVWNVGFFDGTGVIWPDAPQLRGISMQLMQAGLIRRGISSSVRAIPLADIGTFRGAFFTNSSQPVRALAAIDDVEFAVDAEFIGLLGDCYESNEPERI